MTILKFLNTYMGALLTSGILWAILIVLKIQPKCKNCLALEKLHSSVMGESVNERRHSAKLEAQVNEQKLEIKALVDRMMLNAGVKDNRPAPTEIQKDAAAKAEEERLEKLHENGGLVMGGAD
jgi:hypothetical protein